MTRNDAPNTTISNPQPYNKIGDGPEGPEVYVMTKKFEERIPCGSTLIKLDALCKRYSSIPAGFTTSFPLVVQEITSKGKKTIVKFDKDWSLLISYGMTGQWDTDRNGSAQLEFTFRTPKKATRLYYWTSSRNLSTCTIQFLSHSQLENCVAKLGLDIILDDPDRDTILEAYGKSKKNVCAFIMDQTRFCGIGNYIKAVTLYRCRVSPHSKINELDEKTKLLIWRVAKKVAMEAVAANRGANHNLEGFDMTPYNMTHDKHGNLVIAEDIAGRTTWWVPAMVDK